MCATLLLLLLALVGGSIIVIIVTVCLTLWLRLLSTGWRGLGSAWYATNDHSSKLRRLRLVSIIATIATIAAITEKKKRSAIVVIIRKPHFSDRSISQQSLKSCFHMIATIAERFYPAIAATVEIVAIIWKPAFRNLPRMYAEAKNVNTALTSSMARCLTALARLFSLHHRDLTIDTCTPFDP